MRKRRPGRRCRRSGYDGVSGLWDLGISSLNSIATTLFLRGSRIRVIPIGISQQETKIARAQFVPAHRRAP